MNQRRNELLSHYIKKELVGLEAKVIPKHSTSDVVEGVIINETMSIIEIFDGSRIKKFIKNTIDLDVEFGKEENILIEGNLLDMRPEDRMKKSKIKI